ncbi:MAG: PLP-dependent aminotransferase family protein [Chloroflexota bacterium]
MIANDLPQGMTRNTISLLLGHPDPATVFTPELHEAMQSVLNQPQAYKALQYGPEQGTPGLISYLVDKVNREQDLALQPANMMLVAGSTHAIDMIARLFTKPGDIAIVEAPSYVDALHVFRDQQIELCSIPMDEHGLIVTELATLLAQLKSEGKTPRFLYSVPNFHNPTGITLSEERRVQIIALAQQYSFFIIEDDVYRYLGFERSLPTSFYALAQGERVMSIGSFSKTLAPGLRIGWLTGSPEAIQQCVNAGTTQMGGGANPLAAQMVMEYCLKGYWEWHIQRLQALYQQRRDTALAALSQFMPADVIWTTPLGGFFIWITLPKTIFAQEVKRLALHQGVTLSSGEGFFINFTDGQHNLRIAYSFASLSDLEAGIKILGQIIRNLQHP